MTTVKKLKFVSQERGNKSFELFIPEIVVEKCHFSLIAEQFLGPPKSIETAQNNLLLCKSRTTLIFAPGAKLQLPKFEKALKAILLIFLSLLPLFAFSPPALNFKFTCLGIDCISTKIIFKEDQVGSGTRFS